MPGNKKRDPIPESFASIEEAADFWDRHDFADYADQLREVRFKADLQRRTYLTALEPELAKKVSAYAATQGVGSETLINIWLTERLTAATAKK